MTQLLAFLADRMGQSLAPHELRDVRRDAVGLLLGLGGVLALFLVLIAVMAAPS